MTHPIDNQKLQRVRDAMGDADLDAIVVRAPDNVLYLTNYWPMKGFEIVVFPREGEPTLVAMDAQLRDAHAAAWTSDIRSAALYEPTDPRPTFARAVELAIEALRERDLTRRVGMELSLFTAGADRMVGEPTLSSYDYFNAVKAAVGELIDATPLLTRARMVKTEQELQRMRLANELADNALDRLAADVACGMKLTEVVAAFEGHVHVNGVGHDDRVDMARAFVMAWSGTDIRPFAATGAGVVQENAPTLLEIWVAADGYWTDLGKNLCPGGLGSEYERLLETLLPILDEAVTHARPGQSLAELDRMIRARISEAGHGEQRFPMVHGVGARAHEPPFAHQAGGGTIEAGMVLAIEPGVFLESGGGVRLENNWSIGRDANEQLSRFPDDPRLVSAGR